jgi:hypothetical protein
MGDRRSRSRDLNCCATNDAVTRRGGPHFQATDGNVSSQISESLTYKYCSLLTLLALEALETHGIEKQFLLFDPF